MVLQAKLVVVDRLVVAHELESLVKVLKGSFELADEEVADASLEVGNGEIIVEVDGGIEVLDLAGRTRGTRVSGSSKETKGEN